MILNMNILRVKKFYDSNKETMKEYHKLNMAICETQNEEILNDAWLDVVLFLLDGLQHREINKYH